MQMNAEFISIITPQSRRITLQLVITPLPLDSGVISVMGNKVPFGARISLFSKALTELCSFRKDQARKICVIAMFKGTKFPSVLGFPCLARR